MADSEAREYKPQACRSHWHVAFANNEVPGIKEFTTLQECEEVCESLNAALVFNRVTIRRFIKELTNPQLYDIFRVGVEGEKTNGTTGVIEAVRSKLGEYVL